MVVPETTKSQLVGIGYTSYTNSTKKDPPAHLTIYRMNHILDIEKHLLDNISPSHFHIFCNNSRLRMDAQNRNIKMLLTSHNNVTNIQDNYT